MSPGQAGCRRRIQRIGILSGGGSLPLEIADSARRRGHDVHIVALDGEADADFGTPQGHVRQLGPDRHHGSRAQGAPHAMRSSSSGACAGRSCGGFRTDLGFFLNLPSLLKIVGLRRRRRRAAAGDPLLRGSGLTVIGPAVPRPSLSSARVHSAMRRRLERMRPTSPRVLPSVRALGAYDVGQGVIVSGGVVEAIEGAEGTDTHAGADGPQRGDSAGRRHGVFVKRSKPSQDLRVDMPAIGPDTMARVGACGARRSLLSRPARCSSRSGAMPSSGRTRRKSLSRVSAIRWRCQRAQSRERREPARAIPASRPH